MAVISEALRDPDLALELTLRYRGYELIAGLDEAGRGAWAGPVVAAAVILPLDRPGLARELTGLRDSKLLSVEQREAWAERIRALSRALSVGAASPEEIDAHGIVPATRMAMMRALEGLSHPPEHLLVDHLKLTEVHTRQIALTKGDRRALSIAAASVVAKVQRDARMVAADRHHPDYGFCRHKGYGTQEHRSALAQLGPSPLHRRSFAPVAARRANGLGPDARS
jgi:ribonuclease HII